jgi:hypothetical protein
MSPQLIMSGGLEASVSILVVPSISVLQPINRSFLSKNVYQLSLSLHPEFWKYLIYDTPTNALLYYNSLKSLH